MMRRILLLILTLVTKISVSVGQDHIYSQFYNSPIYLNPALNGQFEGDFRFNAIYRNQWTNLPGPLSYYTFSADLNVPKFGGGFGIMINKSSEGTAYLSKLNFSGIYSYSVDFNNAVLSFGLQAGLTNRSIDYSKLVYFDQLDENGIILNSPNSSTKAEYNNKYFFDAGAGINLVLGKLMVGGSTQHLNKPNESFTGLKSTLPMRVNSYVSYKIFLNPYSEESEEAFVPSIVYYNQGSINSISAGMQFKTKSINVGLWYRGKGTESDAVVVSLIFDLFVKRSYNDKLRLGVSHDATISRLNYGKTAGTSEMALSYETTLFQHSNDYGGKYRDNSSGRRCYDFY